MKKFFKIFRISLIIILLLLSVSAIIAYVNRDSIKQALIDQIDKAVCVPVDVHGVEFSFLEKFPFASVSFNNVEIKSLYNKQLAKPLLKSSKISVHFNLFQIIRREYSLKNISVENGEMNILINRKAKANYEIFSNKNDTSKVDFNIENLFFKDVNFSFISEKENLYFEFFIKRNSISLNQKGPEVEIISKARLKDFEISSEGKILKESKSLNYNISCVLNKKQFVLYPSDIEIDKLNLRSNGKFNFSTKYLILNCDFENAEVYEIVSFLPIEKVEEKCDYDGELSGNLIVEGKFSGKTLPNMQLKSKLKDGHFINQKISLEDVNSEIDFSSSENLNHWNFKVPAYSLRFQEQKLNGNAQINTKDSAFLNCNFKNIQAKNLNKYFGSNIEIDAIASGEILASISTNDFVAKIFDQVKLYGFLKLENTDFKLSNLKYNLFAEEIELRFDRKKIEVEKCSAKYKDTKIELDGKIDLAKRNFVSANLNWKADYLNFEDIAEIQYSEGDSDFEFQVKIDGDIKNFKYEKSIYKNLKFYSVINTKSMQLHEASANAFGGKITGNIDINFGDKTNQINSDLEFRDVNVKNLMTSFNNFEQDFLIADHISGMASGEIKMKSEWDYKWQLIFDKLFVESEIEIVDGQLDDFEPLYELSRFIELEELKHVKFSKFNNSFTISKRQLFFPEMSIKNNAASFRADGKHSFSGIFDYHVELKLSDFLFKKSRKSTFDEIQIEDDGLGNPKLFLRIFGTSDDFKVVYDKEKLGKSLKSKIKQEREILEENKAKVEDEKVEKPKKQTVEEEFHPKLIWDDSDSLDNKPDKKQKPDTTKKAKKPKRKLKPIWEDE